MAMMDAVKAKDLKWLPKGSEFYLESEDSNSNSSSKSKTYTSFTCSQDSLPEFSNNKIGFKEPLDDINIARLGPGQVITPHPPAPLSLLFPPLSFLFLLLLVVFGHYWWSLVMSCLLVIYALVYILYLLLSHNIH